MKLVAVGIEGDLNTPFWLDHSERGNPKPFFDDLDGPLRARLLKAIGEYADSEHLGVDRGHPMEWEYETPPNADAILYKFKIKNFVYRFYAVVHGSGEDRKSVIVHGYKAAKSAAKKEKDDKRERTEKRLAEKRAVEYLSLFDGKEPENDC